MSTTCNPYRGFRFPAEIINQAVWLYHSFSLSLREVELILAARGIMVSYETIREWSLRFGQAYARKLKRRRPQGNVNLTHLLVLLSASAKNG
jgi:putative transposase